MKKTQTKTRELRAGLHKTIAVATSLGVGILGTVLFGFAAVSDLAVAGHVGTPMLATLASCIVLLAAGLIGVRNMGRENDRALRSGMTSLR